MKIKLFTLSLVMIMAGFQLGAQEICDNGIDDDTDGLIDGLDPDCNSQAAWSCESTGIIMKQASVYSLNFSSGVITYLGAAATNSQAIGYNLSENLVWGVDTDGKIFSMGSDLSITLYPTTGATISSSTSYNCAEVGGDALFIYSSSESEVLKVDIDSNSASYLEVTSHVITGVNFADFAYNSIDGMLYSVEGDNQNLYRIDPNDLSMTDLGTTGLPDASGVVSFGKLFSDANGNIVTYTTKAGYELENKLVVLKKVHDYKGGYQELVTVNTTVGGDGAFCYSNVIFTNEVCDNLIDDDGDGDVDCDDSDCDYFGDCVLLDGTIASTENSCQNGLVTFQTFFTNNSGVTAEFDVQASLASGFVYAHDSISFSDEVSVFSFTSGPTDGDTGSLSWSSLSLEAGETARLTFDAIVDGSQAYADYITSVTVTGANLIQTTLNATVTIEDCSVLDTYECDPAFYQVYRKKGSHQPNVYGVLNPVTGDYTQIALASEKANGLGFDINTGLVYGASGKKFIQLEEDGTVLYLGLNFAKNCYRGDMDDNGFWWGAVGSDMIKVDPTVPEVVATYSGQAMSGWDMAFNKDGNFYALHGEKLYKFDTTTNTKSYLGVVNGDGIPTTGYGGQWTGSDGRLYASNNKYGSIVRVDVTTLEARIVSSSIDGLSQNDGFSCPSSIPAVYEFDYGDNSKLLQSRILNYYQDLDNDDVPDFTSVWLGATTTYDEIDPKNAAANGDLDDGFDISTEILSGEVTASFDLNSTNATTAYYGIGVDWDDDGVFDFESFSSESIDGVQSFTLDLTVPNGMLFGNVNARMIISETEVNSGVMFGDILEMGEVEDLRIFIYTAEDCGNGLDDDGDGLTDCDDPDCSNAEITSIYINQSERLDLTEGLVVCTGDLESDPILINSGVFGTSESAVFTITGVINDVIIDNTSPYQISLSPVLGEVTISVAAYVEDDGGGLGLCTAEQVTFTFEECVEICNNGIDDDYDGLTDCDDPDCQISTNAGNDKDVDYNASALLYGSVTGGEANYSYVWTPNTEIDDNSLASPTISPSVDRTYTVTVTDANGCSNADQVFVHVDGDGQDPLLYPCGWDEDGTLNCLETTTLICDEDFLDDLNYTYKEGRDLTVELSHALQYDGAGDIHVIDDNTEVFVTFIHEGTPYQNSLAYYTYNTSSPLVDEDEVLNMTTVFPNMSYDAGESGAITYGDKVSLGTFNSGTSIGFALITRGWQSTTQTVQDNYLTVYSSHKLNPETLEADRIHSHSSIDNHNNGIIFGFEEINREYLSCDNDFNDVLFLVNSSDSQNDFDLSNLYALYDNSVGNNCVPCGLLSNSIGLYKATVNWSTLSNATSYKVRYRRWGTNDDWNYMNAGTNTSLIVGSIDNLDPGTHYEWQVSAYFGATQGCNSVTNVFTTLPECEMPTGNSATSITETSATLSWGGVLSAEKYTVRYKPFGTADSEYQWRNAGTNTFLAVTDLTPGTTYDWSVAATCGASHSCYGPYQDAHNFTTESSSRSMQESASLDVACQLPLAMISFEQTQPIQTDFEVDRALYNYDIDGDGLEDIILKSADGLNKISVYLNNENPDLRFNTFYDVNIPEPVDYLNFSHINNDELVDIVFTNVRSEKIWILENLSQPGNIMVEEFDFIETDIEPTGIAGINLDGGPRVELISLSSGNDQVYLFEKNKTQAQASHAVKSYNSNNYSHLENFTTGKAPSKLKMTDFNQDGRQDVAIINKLENTLTLFYNRIGNNDSIPHVNTHFTTGNLPVDLDIADINSDGLMDVVVANAGENSISIFQNLSGNSEEFTFVPLDKILLERAPKEVACGDFNGDGIVELVVSFEESNVLSIYQLTDVNQMTFTLNRNLSLESNVERILVFNPKEKSKKSDLAVSIENADAWIYFRNDSPISKPQAEITKYYSEVTDEAELKGFSDLEGEYNWELLVGNTFTSLMNSETISGANSQYLTISDPASLSGATLRFVATDEECPSIKTTTTVKMDELLGARNRKISVAPNPNEGLFYLRINKLELNSTIQIISPRGRIIEERSLGELEGNITLDFDLTDQAQGAYLIKLIDLKETHTAKLIIK